MYKNNMKLPHTKLKVVSLAFSTFFLSAGIWYCKQRKLKEQRAALSRNGSVEECVYIEAPFYSDSLSEISTIKSFLKIVSGRDSVGQLLPLRLLLKCLHSRDANVRDKAISLIHARCSFSEADVSTVLQAATPHLLLHLSRHPLPFLLKPPTPLPHHKNDTEHELLRLLEHLPVQHDEHKHHLTTHKLSSYVDKTICLGFETYNDSAHESTTHSTNHLLTSLLLYSQWPENCSYLLHHNIFFTLRNIYETAIDSNNFSQHTKTKKTSNNNKIQENEKGSGSVAMMRLQLSMVLNNILINTSSSSSSCLDALLHSGWLYHVAQWSMGGDASMHASRLLDNMSNTLLSADAGVVNPPMYDNRVFLVKIGSSAPRADVIFIHGLRGAPNRTWRQANQQDHLRNQQNNIINENHNTEIRNANKIDNSNVKNTNNHESDKNICGTNRVLKGEKNGEIYDATNNWPKDWLGEDVPGLRVLMVQYQNHLSYWSQNKHIEIKSLKEQSDLLLASLRRAGLGSRPVIFVGHSMGGLLIKQIISTLNEQDNNHILNQVKGVVFYSVPHRGSYLVNYSRNASLLLSPTKQVLQLSEGSSDLKQLHAAFLDILKKRSNIRLLSFTEGKPTNLPFKIKAKIVSELSSDMGVGDLHVLKDSDHVDVCKPSSKLSPAYTLTRDFIRSCLQ